MDTSDLPEEKEEEEKSSQEGGSLQWVKELHVLPMEHEIMGAEPSSDQPEYNPASHDIDYILGNLEVYDLVQYPVRLHFSLPGKIPV